MPRIEDRFLDAVIYLYPSDVAANSGESIGGSGFLLVDLLSDRKFGLMYAVSNWHVIYNFNSPVIRLNTRRGEKEVIPLKQGDWFEHGSYDLAVAPLSVLDREIYKYACVSTNDFLTQDIIKDHDIGPGDDVFMVGRFVSHEGKQRNLPLIRFGNISMMPYEKLADSYGRKQKVFLVEMRSLVGFSGSPVFVFLASNVVRQSDINEDGTFKRGAEHEITMRGPWLLGVDCADLPYRERVFQVVKIAGVQKDMETDYVAYSNSGQMAVIPSWRLLDFLNTDERCVMRKQKAERRLAEEKRKAPLRGNATKGTEQD